MYLDYVLIELWINKSLRIPRGLVSVPRGLLSIPRRLLTCTCKIPKPLDYLLGLSVAIKHFKHFKHRIKSSSTFNTTHLWHCTVILTIWSALMIMTLTGIDEQPADKFKEQGMIWFLSGGWFGELFTSGVEVYVAFLHFFFLLWWRSFVAFIWHRFPDCFFIISLAIFIAPSMHISLTSQFHIKLLVNSFLVQPCRSSFPWLNEYMVCFRSLNPCLFFHRLVVDSVL